MSQSYGYRKRRDPPTKMVPQGHPEPRVNAPIGGEPHRSRRLPGQGHLGQATAGVLKSEDELFLIDLTNGIISISDETEQPRFRAGLLSVDPDDYGVEILDSLGNAIFTADGLGVNIVGTANIAPEAITEALLATDAVTSTKLASGSVTTTKIQPGAVTEVVLAPGSVTTTRIGENAVTTVEIADNTIVAGNIFAGTITAAEIAAGTITANEIAAATITAGQIAANTITAGQIAANTISAAEIAAGTITSAQIAAGTIQAGDILAETITSNELASRTITADRIAVGAITANEISADTITSAEIAAGTITAFEIAAGTITANELSSNQVSALFASLGTIEAGILRDTAQKITLDLNNQVLQVYDDQVTPQLRVTLGKLGAGSTDYGLVLRDQTGGLLLDASGLGVDVVGTTQIENGAITTAKIGTAQVDTANIATAAIQTAQIGDAQITTAKIGAAQITDAKIANATITAASIADATITTAKIGDAQITNAKIGSLDAGKITTGFLSASRIQSSSIDASKLASLTISVGKFIASDNYVAGSAGWYLDDTDAELNDVTIRGTLDGVGGTFTGSLSAADGTFGTITAGLLQYTATRYLDLSAAGTDPFFRFDDVIFRADGTREWPDEVQNPPAIRTASQQSYWFDQMGDTVTRFEVEWSVNSVVTGDASDYRISIDFYRGGEFLTNDDGIAIGATQPYEKEIGLGDSSDMTYAIVYLYEQATGDVLDERVTQPKSQIAD